MRPSSVDRFVGLTRGLARKFYQELQTTAGGEIGWGQFLDAPRLHSRVGLYGTAAGVIVIAQAGAEQEQTLIDARNQLRCWWVARNQNEKLRARFTQTLRLELFLMAWGLSDGAVDVEREVTRELLERQLPKGGWGDWWINNAEHDQNSRIFPTSLAVLSLSGSKRELLAEVRPALQRAESFLVEELNTAARIATLESAATLAAIAFSNPKRLRQLKSLSSLWRSAFVGSRGSYFFFYQYRGDSAEIVFAQDYFLVPPKVLAALAGVRQSESGRRYVEALELAKTLASELEAGNLFRLDRNQPASTIDQAWIAMLFSAVASSRRRRFYGARGRVQYELLKERPNGVVMGRIFPLAVVAIAVAATVVADSAPLFARIIVAVIAAGLAGFYRDAFKLTRDIR